MLSSWRRMVSQREDKLRKQRQRKLDADSWVPAYLTSFSDEPVDMSLGLVGKQIGEGVAAMLDEADVLDDGAGGSASEPEDTDFVFEWQKHAEEMREREEEAMELRRMKTARKNRLGSSRLRAAPLMERLRSHRKTEFSNGDSPTIGIDLGTTNSAVAAVSGGKPFIIVSRDGQRVSPSVVSFVSGAGAAAVFPRPLLEPQGFARVVVGEGARRQTVSNAANTFSSMKRLIGRTATAGELRELSALDVPHKVAGRDILLVCPAMRRLLSPIDCAAEVVRELLRQATDELQVGAIERAVVTVPAYFDGSQRAATETACLLAGLQDVRLLREPEAAALSYAIEQQVDERVMVFDLGGGTFDVSILDVGGGVVEVVATSGDPRLGGDDWDAALAQWLEDEFVRQHGAPLDGFGRRRLRDAAEEAKVGLSSVTSVQVEVPFLVGDTGLNVTLTRRKFEAITRSLVLRLVEPMLEVARMGGVEFPSAKMGTLAQGELANAPPRVQEWRKKVAWRWRRMARRNKLEGMARRISLDGVPVSKVLLVGGATRMPVVGRFIKRMTGLTARPLLNPEEAVALGAAVQGGIMDGRVDQKVWNPYFHERALNKLAEDPSVGRR